MSSPTQRTLAHFRGLGYAAAVTEHWNHHTKRRHDLFGFIDILAIDFEHTVAIQATSTGNMGARVDKILTERRDIARQWLNADACREILVIGWKKYAKPVNRKLWRPTLRWIGEEDFE